MVAPNGARLGKADHPAIPITLDEVLATASECHAAGADGLHLHLRDKHGRHILDAGLYREALAELSSVVPNMDVQITTEAVGLYSSEHQRKVALNSGARLVSTSIRELMADSDAQTTSCFFNDCKEAGRQLQVILYDVADLMLLKKTIPEASFNSTCLQILFVLGRYSANRDSHPDDMQPFLDWMKQADWRPDWAICAFGRGETACLEKAHSEGGKLRVGFENSLWASDGTQARDNAQRVSEIVKVMQEAAIN
ncbi:3-keto-5-aminohexanoate cleavage protein [uncultured Roseovarius sp.]|uniref:3-keto-5-aminohexanoate cleavage protein n=1 Tax=uncultured Roseovarius sp. TaxID=293344 RepID=UPI00261C6BA0|nr:3-keto-5-aminohexanoate cleavage protein [uncultured Roseovarius sp.]